MNYRYIAVEGNIGSGKSTLANLLSEHYNARLILEQFADNNFLPKFYTEPERYAFPLELSFLADRYKQQKDLLHTELFQENIVSDYVFAKSKLFARTNLKDDEYTLFQRFFEIVENHLPKPDLVIYLHMPINRLQQNIRKRGRSFEQDISNEYLEKVQQVYQQYLKQEAQKTLIVDAQNADFLENPEHFAQLVAFLEKDYDYTSHYLAIN